MWHSETRKTHFGHQLLSIVIAAIIIILFIFDFLHRFGDFKKITFNLSFSIVFIPEVLKQYYLLFYYKEVNYIRRTLHNICQSRKNEEEEEEINTVAAKEVKILYACLYFAYWFCIPIGLYLFYVQTIVDFPFPLRPPFEMDFSDPVLFNIAFSIATIITGLVFLFILEEEMMVFTLLIQVSREYKVLIKDIMLLSRVYEEINKNICHRKFGKRTEVEVNPVLQISHSKKMIKQFSNNQKIIIE